jgi:hypothetical protein
MKKKVKRLELHRETLRLLGTAQLHGAMGGTRVNGPGDISILPPEDSCITCSCTNYLTCLVTYCPKLVPNFPDPPAGDGGIIA